MEILNDKHRILMTVDHKIFNNEAQLNKELIISFFENLINSNQYSINPNIIHHYFYELKKNNNFNHTEIENTIINIINLKIRESRNNFRKINKSNNMKIIYVVNFIKLFHRILKNVDTLMNNNVKTNEKPWGTSKIIENSMFNLFNNLIVDEVIMYTLKKAVRTFDNIYEYVNFIKIICCYNNDFLVIKNKIEEGLLDNLTSTNESNTYLNNLYIDKNIVLVLKFRDSLIFYREIKKKYNYVIYDKKYNISNDYTSILSYIVDIFSSIFKSFKLNDLIMFIKTYGKEINGLFKNISNKSNIYLKMFDLESIIFDRLSSITSTFDLIEYGNTIYTIIDDKLKVNFRNIIKNFINNKYKMFINDSNKFEVMVNFTKDISNKILDNNFKDCLFTMLFTNFYGDHISDLNEIFIKHMEKELIYRIIYHNTKLPIELIVYNYMSKYYSLSSLFNYRQILYDFEKSSNQMITVTPEIWGINISAGYYDYKNTNTSTNFNNFIKPLCDNFENNNRNKQLFIHGHLGIVDMNFKSNFQTTNILLLPIQMFFLDLFEKNTVVCGQDFLDKLKPYNNPRKIYSDIIQVFLNNHLIIPKPNNFYKINMDYDEQDYLNLVTEYNNFSNVDVVVNNIIKEQLAFSNEIVTSTVVNKILKSQKLDYEDLYSRTKDNIKVFDLNETTFKKVIDEMITKDYIVRENDNYLKVVY